VSFLSGHTDNIPLADQKALGLDSRRLSTQEQARPVPYMAGRRMVGVTWLSNLYFIHTEEHDSGKKTGSGQTDFVAAFAGMLCHGPVDALYKVRIDGKVVWEGEVIRGAEDAVDIAVTGYGPFRIYWGTETQGVDDVLALSGEGHPAYRGRCYVNCLFYLGRGKKTAPQLEFEIARWPVIDWLTAPVNIDGDCNPIAFIAEMAQNPRFGARLSDERIDTALLDAVANRLADEGIGLSPLLDRQLTFREFLMEALQYFDGYHYRTAAGKLAIGLNRELISGSVPTISVSDMLSEPKIQPAAWEKTTNTVWVKFINREKEYNEDVVAYRNAANYQIVGRQTTKTLDRTWITRADMASKICAPLGRQMGLPETTGSVPLKKSSASGLSIGQQFILCYPQTGLNLACRLTEKNFPDAGRPRVEIQFQVDRSYLNSDDLFIPSTPPPNPAPVNEPAPIVKQRLIELPYGVAVDGYENGIGFLAARPNGMTTSLHVHRRKPSGSYEDILSAPNYARHGLLKEEYPAETDLIDDDIGLLIQLDQTDTTLPNFPYDDALTNDWLLFVDGEIMSLFNATLVAAGKYRVYAIRNRFDTERKRHYVGTDVFIMRRAVLPHYVEAGSASPQTYKLQPFVLNAGLDLSEIASKDLALSFRGLRPWQPANATASSASGPMIYGAGENVVVTWNDVTPDPTLADVPKTLFQVLDTSNNLRHEEIINAGVETKTLLNADLVTWLGAEYSFRVRLYHVRAGDWRSSRYLPLEILTA
jgi:hypothetical protein